MDRKPQQFETTMSPNSFRRMTGEGQRPGRLPENSIRTTIGGIARGDVLIIHEATDGEGIEGRKRIYTVNHVGPDGSDPDNSVGIRPRSEPFHNRGYRLVHLSSVSEESPSPES